MTPAPYILLDDQITPSVRLYTEPSELIIINDIRKIADGFARLEAHHKAGRYIAGYFSYELGYALEPALKSLMPKRRSVPLMAFGAFQKYQNHMGPEFYVKTETPDFGLAPKWDEAQYTKRFDQFKTYLEAGDCYQINLTFPMSGKTELTAQQIYAALRGQQRGKYGGIVSLGPKGGPEIISLSPELFFRKTGQEITMRPMKGTLPRRINRMEDIKAAKAMQSDEKSMAENLMIVDLLRNDLSRISEPGTVTVPELYALETYPTLHQMTSLVRGELALETPLELIIRNLFPSGSVTGAPKIRAMEIIRELEQSPRGAYCGSLGYLDPNGDSCFNVGIRTLTLSRKKLTYNVGSGVVLDSQPPAEYAECLLKAKVLDPARPDLIETLRWTPRRGFLRKDLHLDRISSAALALGYPFDRTYANDALKYAIRTKGTRQRIRVTLSPEGRLNIEMSEYSRPDRPWRFSLSKNPLTPSVQLTAFKTTDRGFYDGERARVSAITGCDEVLFFNDKGELTEGSFTNIFIEKNGVMLTPALSSGLLPGVYRQSLLDAGKAQEAVLTIDDLAIADFTFVGNSLRGLIQADIIAFDKI